MDYVFIEGVRCFYYKETVPLKPLTLLVGENSSGKSTFLALVRLIWDISQLEFPITMPMNFNEEPFPLGSYAQIASFKGGQAGRVKDFLIGCKCEVPVGKSMRKISLTGRFVEHDGQPRLSDLSIDSDPYNLTLMIEPKRGSITIEFITPSGKFKYSIEAPPFSPYSFPFRHAIRFMLNGSFSSLAQKSREKAKSPSKGEIDEINRILEGFVSKSRKRPYAFAPIRTRPQRNYEPFLDVPGPEGSHVPVILARMLKINPEGGERLLESLDRFGAASGLFKDVEVRRLGKKESDPFQIKVKISGPAFNMVDVGYGVSQVLPIVVDVLREPSGSTFLMQQPEVHLHPRAQAELGSFIASLASKQKKYFLVETHSDYLLDRVRMDIRDGKSIKAEDVAILFFERINGGVTIHHIQIDETGNIINAPPGYRRFFLEEERRLFEG